MAQYSSWRNQTKATPTQAGRIRFLLLVAGLMSVGLIASLRVIHAAASSNSLSIQSVKTGYCLDVYKDLATPNAIVDSWPCNHSGAQAWTLTPTTIEHGSTECLSVKNNATSEGSPVVLNNCSNASGQVWLRDQSGFINPNSGLCLSQPGSQGSDQLIINSCNALATKAEGWQAVNSHGKISDKFDCSSGSLRQKISCSAVNQWIAWQSGQVDHNTLLNLYSDGNGYEEWCADFVSYVYKTAGRPFTDGERGLSNWDEYDANNIENQGLTYHAAGAYLPQAGDIAFFNYSGGHVEIVVSGGTNPTFVYGDSATIDPQSGNGTMATNTITSDGSLGQVIYYLSPSN